MPTLAVPTRIKLRNILFATDFSQSSEAVLSHALDLARHYGAVLYTVHVLPHTKLGDAAHPAADQTRLLADQQLPALVKSASFKDVEHNELMEQGDVAEVLSKLVHDHAIDLIVIGTGGRKKLKKLMMGSVAEAIFRSAVCPVLTIGPHANRWSTDGSLKHILFATNFKPESLHGVPYAVSLAEDSRAHLTLLHVAPEPGVTMPEFLPMIDPRDRVATTKDRLRNLIPGEAELWHQPEYMVQFGWPAETIVRIAASQSVDMIVLGVKRQGSLTTHAGDGVAYEVVCEAPCPVLSVGPRYHV